VSPEPTTRSAVWRAASTAGAADEASQTGEGFIPNGHDGGESEPTRAERRREASHENDPSVFDQGPGNEYGETEDE
jgi:hypothetical protein